jgi:hypothetical protein
MYTRALAEGRRFVPREARAASQPERGGPSAGSLVFDKASRLEARQKALTRYVESLGAAVRESDEEASGPG